MNNKLERMWKETVLASFQVLSQNVPGGLRKKTENLSHDSLRCRFSQRNLF
jgi:hypothetical protein